MSLIKDALDLLIQRGKDLNTVQRFSIDGKEYANVKLQQVWPDPLPPALPLRPTLTLNTLSGLADVIREKFEDLDPNQYLVHVVSHGEASLIAKLADQHGRRQMLAA